MNKVVYLYCGNNRNDVFLEQSKREIQTLRLMLMGAIGCGLPGNFARKRLFIRYSWNVANSVIGMGFCCVCYKIPSRVGDL